MPDHSPSTDESASLAQPSQSSSPLECTSHLGFSLVPFPDGLVDTGKSPPTMDSSLRGNDGQAKRVSGIRHIQVEVVLVLSPNPPMDTDGRREDTGRGVRKLQKRWSGLDSGRREVGGGLQALLGAPMAAYSGCGEGDGGIGHGKRRSRTGLARVVGAFSCRGRWVSGGRAPSGREWNGSQPGQGATALGFPRPALWQMQGEAACRAGDPSG